MAKRIETLITTFAHVTGAVAIGSLTEFVFRKLEYHDNRAVRDEIYEAGMLFGQLAVSSLVMAEFTAAFIPTTDDYISPVGDGLLTYFLFESQPSFRRRLHDLLQALVLRSVEREIDAASTQLDAESKGRK